MSEQNTNVRDDEIDLFDLFDDIREKWKQVVVFLALGILGALIYVFLATPVYRTDVVIKDAPASDLVAFNQPALRTTLVLQGRTDSASPEQEEDAPALSHQPVFELDSATAFSGARSVVRSSAARKAYYQRLLRDDNPELRRLLWNEALTEEQNLGVFLDRFAFTDPGAKDKLDTYMTVSFELGENPQLAADILNGYVDFALARYDHQIRYELKRKLDAQLQLNRSWADSLRAAYVSEKERRMLLLNEAAEVAASIGQTLPFYSASEFVVSGKPPLYMMGEKALRKEAEQLKARSGLQSEDLFIAGLPQILQNTAILESVNVDWDSVNYVLIDQPALLPRKAAKPNKKLVVALGAVGGLMLGILAALLAAASSRHVVRKRP